MSSDRKPAATVTVVGSEIRWDFSNGKALAVDVNRLSDEVKFEGLKNGIEQKVRDGYALPYRTDKTGRIVRPSVDEKYEAARVIVERLTAVDGEWNAPRAGGSATGGILFAAIGRCFPGKFADIAAFRAWCAERAATLVASGEDVSADDVEKSIARSKRIREMIETIRAERVPPSAVSLGESLVGELEDAVVAEQLSGRPEDAVGSALDESSSDKRGKKGRKH